MLSREQRTQQSEYAARMIASMNNGFLGCGIADPNGVGESERQANAYAV